MPDLAALELRDPLLLLLAVLAVPVFLIGRRPAGRLVFSSLSILPPAAERRSLRARLAALPAVLLALATAALGVAIAGPRVGDEVTRVRREGIAIMSVIDVSSSMRALDLSLPDRERTRLDAVRDVFAAFVSGEGELRGRPDDVIGLVTFAGWADCRCPLTLDHRNLATIVDDLAIVTTRAEDGTAVGDGLGLALERLRASAAASKVAILLTDGVQNAGELTPVQAAELAATLGVRVYTVGAGTEGLAPMRTTDPFTGREVLRQVPVRIDEATLREIAERTGGRYFRATDAASLAEVYQEIDRLERSEVTETRYLQYRELFPEVTALAIALVALATVLQASWLRRLP